MIEVKERTPKSSSVEIFPEEVRFLCPDIQESIDCATGIVKSVFGEEADTDFFDPQEINNLEGADYDLEYKNGGWGIKFKLFPTEGKEFVTQVASRSSDPFSSKVINRVGFEQAAGRTALVSPVEGNLDFVTGRNKFLASLGIDQEESIKQAVFRILVEEYFDFWAQSGNSVDLFVPLLRIARKQEDTFKEQVKVKVLEIFANSDLPLAEKLPVNLEELLIRWSLDIRQEREAFGDSDDFYLVFKEAGQEIFNQVYQDLGKDDRTTLFLSLANKMKKRSFCMTVDEDWQEQKRIHSLVLELAWRQKAVYDLVSDKVGFIDNSENNIINFRIFPENRYAADPPIQSLVNAFASLFVGQEPGYISKIRGWQVAEDSRKEIEQRAEELLKAVA